MTFDCLVLNNFGPYRGRVKIDFESDTAKPILLIGATNGTGKTTLADALQLALYGKLANCSNRQSLAYEEYLRRSIHRSANQDEGAAVELSFHQVVDSQKRNYRILRRWLDKGNRVRELLSVEVDGQIDRVLTQTWDSYVETIFPRSIAPLFFFDGEKIEALADPSRSSKLLETALHSLLGIDLVEQLAADLQVLEQRQLSSPHEGDEAKPHEEAKADLERIEEQLSAQLLEKGQAQNNVDRAAKHLDQVHQQFRIQGGDLYKRRTELEGERQLFREAVRNGKENLRMRAGGSAPLLLVREQLLKILRQADQEHENRLSQLTEHVLEKRDNQILHHLRDRGVSDDAVADLGRFLTGDRSRRANRIRDASYIGLSEEGRAQLRTLLERELGPTGERAINESLETLEDSRVQLDNSERQLANVPDDEAIAGILNDLDTATRALEKERVRLSIHEERLADLQRKRASVDRKLVLLREQLAEKLFEQDSRARVLHHSKAVRETLDVFRGAVIRHHIARIESHVHESFSTLLRKERLFKDLHIAPDSSTVSLMNENGEILRAERLSSGERQLLAVALIWGLSKAANLKLPVVIDTPLSRLDHVHRENLVTDYLPCAGHQVIVLSTDEEIKGDLWERIRPFTAEAYTLIYDDNLQGTQVQKGYFTESK